MKWVYENMKKKEEKSYFVIFTCRWCVLKRTLFFCALVKYYVSGEGKYADMWRWIDGIADVQYSTFVISVAKFHPWGKLYKILLVTQWKPFLLQKNPICFCFFCLYPLSFSFFLLHSFCTFFWTCTFFCGTFYIPANEFSEGFFYYGCLSEVRER